MRKKFVKSSRPTYKRRIKKAQQGMRFVSYNAVSNPTIDITDITNPTNPFSEYNFSTTYDKPDALVVPVREDNAEIESPVVNDVVINKPIASKPVTKTPKSYKGLTAFNKAYDEVEASNPEAKKYRKFLTKMAEQESGFNSVIQNRAGAPAYGYFQFMQDDKKYNNIRQYAGTDVETFRSNPKLQIEAAIKLAKSFEKGFSKEDLELANKNGYSTWGLLGGAWLAGNGGVRKFLKGQGNPSDRHWSKEGKGTDVASRIKMFNFKEGGIVKYQQPAQPIKYMGGYDKRGNMVLPVTNENGMNNITLPEVTVTPRNINLAGAVDRGRRTVGNIGKEILSATTPLGDIESAKDVYQDTMSGNYGQAALGAGLLLLPNFIEKPLKTLKRVGKDYVTIAKDFVSSPKRFAQARKNGTYPLTYKERRRYLEKAHKIGDATSAKVETANMNDYQYRSDNYPNVYHDIRPLEGTNTKYTFNSKTYRNFDNPNHSTGINSRGWNINSHINLRESPNSKFLISAGTVQQNVAHELQHSYQNSLPDLALMADRRTRVNGNKVVNENFITSDALTPLKTKAGTWKGSPTELNSEMMSVRSALNAPRYNLMTPEQQSKTKSYIGSMFRLDDTTVHTMLNELGKLGYRNGGKL